LTRPAAPAPPGTIEVAAAVVRVRHDIDATIAGCLRQALADAIDAYGHVVLDLTDVATLDSAGLSALVRAHQKARSAGSELCLAAPSRWVLTVLHTMKVDGLFPIFDDADAALEWVRRGSR
jgi:anti-sigma B factor antagonist